MTEKPYTLRGLTADDIFPMLNILSGIGIREFKSCFDNAEISGAIKSAADGRTEPDSSAIGLMVAVDIAAVILANLPKCKEDIYSLLSGLSGLTRKEIAALPMNVFLNMIVDLVKKEEFKDFFQDVSGLLKRGI